jgi:hypothetical protein
LGEVSQKVLGHAEGIVAVSTEDLGKLLEVLLVLRILEVVLLEIGPQLLDALSTGRLLLANNIGQLSRELHGLG